MDAKPNISYDDFLKLDIRIGVVKTAELHPNADKLVVLKVDFGDLGERTICAGIREFIGKTVDLQTATLPWLVGKPFAFVVNLAPRMMRGIESAGMILAASNADHSRLSLIEAGFALFSEGYSHGEKAEAGWVVG